MRQTIGQMRMDQADYARDSKKEGAMCAYGLCTASSLKETYRVVSESIE